ncbi:hypothetical protein FEM48_Zijuj01G0250100 [Ziziphus jujuba var. spinosa]|uniref:Uncharacterized protein n=1 Tax=Ziziphus jujuba var. spinosa TaxID=714518 RepID=A0A978W4L9_ZIZJJ|nr:hypothetical protein FEM48_Zijuj01G0250100 [Ziziphus jujuba var. spinosa]
MFQRGSLIALDFKGANCEYIPFGAGRRIYPGMLFGLINAELLLALLFYHFDWKLQNEMKHEELDMTKSFCVTVRRKDDLLVIPLVIHLVQRPIGCRRCEGIRWKGDRKLQLCQ